MTAPWSRIGAWAAVALSTASVGLAYFARGSDPHDGPAWLSIAVMGWPWVLCPAWAAIVLVRMTLEADQSTRQRFVTLALTGFALGLPWLPGYLSQKPWLTRSAALRDSSPWVRSKAVESLGSAPGPEAIGELIKALRDADAEVRYRAAAALAAQGAGAAPAVPALLEALDDQSSPVRVWSIVALAQLPEHASQTVPHLVRLLDHDGSTRIDAMEALGDLGPAAATSRPNVEALLSSPEGYLRRHAATTLGRLGRAANASIPRLRSLVSDEDPTVREEVRAALIALGDGGELPPSVVDSWPREAFSVQRWRQEPRSGRFALYRDLVLQGLLGGRSRAAIVAMLGEPSGGDEPELVYELKSPLVPGEPYIPAPVRWMRIRLGRHGLHLASTRPGQN